MVTARDAGAERRVPRVQTSEDVNPRTVLPMQCDFIRGAFE